VAGIDIVADRLTDEMVGQREQLQVMPFEKIPLPRTIGIVGQGLVDFEMVSPARQFQSVIPEFLGFLAQGLQRQISPLTSKQRDGTPHVQSPEQFRNASDKKARPQNTEHQERFQTAAADRPGFITAFSPRLSAFSQF
jgi:hypothetical protein